MQVETGGENSKKKTRNVLGPKLPASGCVSANKPPKSHSPGNGAQGRLLLAGLAQLIATVTSGLMGFG
jgi:hypothetical protein